MDDQIISELAQAKTLEKALRTLEAKSFPLHLMEVIAQDEFSHDVVVPFPNAQDFVALSVT